MTSAMWWAVFRIRMQYNHSWAQQKLSLLSMLSPLNILLSINGCYFLLDLTDLTINDAILKDLTINAFNCFKKFNDTWTLPSLGVTINV